MNTTPSDEAICRALKILAEGYIRAVSGEEVRVTYTPTMKQR